MTGEAEFVRFKRRMRKARSEILIAVDRFDSVDPLAGHRAEALRLIGEVRDEARLLMEIIEAKGDE